MPKLPIHERCWAACTPSRHEYMKHGGWTEQTDKPDCSSGCRYFTLLMDAPLDWGVCVCTKSPRKVMLTFEHMGCMKFRS